MKAFRFMAAAVSICLLGNLTTSAENKKPVTHDVNKDSFFDTNDTTLLSDWLTTGDTDTAAFDWQAADCDGDGKCTVKDLALTQHALAGNGAMHERNSQFGYATEFWNEGRLGTVGYDFLRGANSTAYQGAFSANWDSVKDCLFHVGKDFNVTDTYEKTQFHSIRYEMDYEAVGNSVLSVYGWFAYPNSIEFFIVDGWTGTLPCEGQKSLGTVESDGKIYDVYVMEKTQATIVSEEETYNQYWSVNRTNLLKDGEKAHLDEKVTMYNHFDAWKALGLDMDSKIYRIGLQIEATAADENGTPPSGSVDASRMEYFT